jgi:hypothetical protein
MANENPTPLPFLIRRIKAHDDAADYAWLEALEVPAVPLRRRHGDTATPRNCRYYGQSSMILQATGQLLTSGGDECAVVFTSYAPCEMERSGALPDESYCPRAERYREGKPVTL